MAREHILSDVTFFVGPSDSLMASYRWHQGEVRIVCSHALQFVHERGIVGFAVGIKQMQFVWQTFLRGRLKDAVDWGNSDPPGEKHRRPGDVPMQGEGTSRTADGELRPE